MPKPAKPSLPQNEVEVLKLTVAISSGLILQLCLIMALQVCLGQLPSFTGMEHGAPHAKAVYMATGLVREVKGCDNWQKLPELLQGCLKITRLVTVIS